MTLILVQYGFFIKELYFLIEALQVQHRVHQVLVQHQLLQLAAAQHQ